MREKANSQVFSHLYLVTSSSEEIKQADDTFEGYEKQAESSLSKKVVDDDL